MGNCLNIPVQEQSDSCEECGCVPEFVGENIKLYIHYYQCKKHGFSFQIHNRNMSYGQYLMLEQQKKQHDELMSKLNQIGIIDHPEIQN